MGVLQIIVELIFKIYHNSQPDKTLRKIKFIVKLPERNKGAMDKDSAL